VLHSRRYKGPVDGTAVLRPSDPRFPSAAATPRHSLGRWPPQEPMPQNLTGHGVIVNREYAEVFQVYRVVA